MDAEYMRDYRARNPDKAAEAALLSKARHRALKRLKDAFPVEFHAFLREEERKLRAERRS